jgi:hypothetical protein
MKIGVAIEAVAAAERELADELIAVGERHKPDHDVFQLSRTLARIERGHVDALAPHAARYETEVADGDGGGAPGHGPLRTAVEKGAELLGRRPEAGLLLLWDLRRLHLYAAGASLDWVALGQAAQAAKDTELVTTVTACHSETLRTLKWTTYRLKEAAPQVLTG